MVLYFYPEVKQLTALWITGLTSENNTEQQKQCFRELVISVFVFSVVLLHCCYLWQFAWLDIYLNLPAEMNKNL